MSVWIFMNAMAVLLVTNEHVMLWCLEQAAVATGTEQVHNAIFHLQMQRCMSVYKKDKFNSSQLLHIQTHLNRWCFHDAVLGNIWFSSEWLHDLHMQTKAGRSETEVFLLQMPPELQMALPALWNQTAN